MNRPPTSDEPLANGAQGPPTEWEGTAQAAARVGVSARKVRYWIEAKRIRARKATQDGREVWLVASSDVTSAGSDRGVLHKPLGNRVDGLGAGVQE